MSYCTRLHPLNSLASTLIVEPCPKSPTGMQKTAPWDPFQRTLALDSGQTLDGGGGDSWRHNNNALAGAKLRLVIILCVGLGVR